LCQDERTLIYDGIGAGKFCPLPFLYNRAYYDTCTRKSSSSSGNLESFFWCPDPSSVIPAQQNLFIQGGGIGKCGDFIIPPCKTHFPIVQLSSLSTITVTFKSMVVMTNTRLPLIHFVFEYQHLQKIMRMHNRDAIRRVDNYCRLLMQT